MDNDLTQNTLIGLTTADTLLNVRALLSLFRDMGLCYDVEDDSRFGLYLMHSLMRNSLQYEVNRLNQED